MQKTFQNCTRKVLKKRKTINWNCLSFSLKFSKQMSRKISSLMIDNHINGFAFLNTFLVNFWNFYRTLYLWFSRAYQKISSRSQKKFCRANHIIKKTFSKFWSCPGTEWDRAAKQIDLAPPGDRTLPSGNNAVTDINT